MTTELKKTKADTDIQACIDEARSFYVIAGAGSGKTTSLVTALNHIRDTHGKRLRRDAQRIVCVTYTKRAVAVIASRLGWDDLFVVSTLHGFLWGEVRRYTLDIRRALCDGIIPALIEKKKLDDNGGNSQKAVTARERIKELEDALQALPSVPNFTYNDSNFCDYAKGDLSHDHVIDVATYMISHSERLQRIFGQKYPYIFVDEAQDTQENVVQALNVLCEKPGLPIVGYFGDPMQQIYDKRAGDFKGPECSQRIPKEENFRCSRAVIDLLNAFRKDIQQFPGAKNAEIEGSVIIRLIQTEKPAAPRGRYSPEQIDRASKKLDEALVFWGWDVEPDFKHLYLVRQMIARRLAFTALHQLFTGEYSSSRSQEDYETGKHFLVKPFALCLYPLVKAFRAKDERMTIDILRQYSPAFDPKGENAKRSLAGMIARAKKDLTELSELWNSSTTGEVLRYAQRHELCSISQRLADNLARAQRNVPYDEEIHSTEKSEWLADLFFQMKTPEIERFCEFIAENTVFSTQHGVKGEQYSRVLVVFDDIGSAWQNYNFAKSLTPQTSGQPTEGQLRLSTRLAYVCFSRAEKDLRIIFFTPDAKGASEELIEQKVFAASQVEVVT